MQLTILFNFATDASVYLKLAYFYEDLAMKEWDDAGVHSQKCYQYYLDNVDPEDTAILTRLGNLLVREHVPDAVTNIRSQLLFAYMILMLIYN